MNRIWRHSGCQWIMQWNTIGLSELESMFITSWQVRSTAPVLELYNFCHQRLRHLSIFSAQFHKSKRFKFTFRNKSYPAEMPSQAHKELRALLERGRYYQRHEQTSTAQCLWCHCYIHYECVAIKLLFHISFSDKFVHYFVYALYKLGQIGRRLGKFVCAFENLRSSTISSAVPVRLSARMEQIDFAGFSWNFYCAGGAVVIHSVNAIRVSLKIGQI